MTKISVLRVYLEAQWKKENASEGDEWEVLARVIRCLRGAIDDLRSSEELRSPRIVVLQRKALNASAKPALGSLALVIPLLTS